MIGNELKFSQIEDLPLDYIMSFIYISIEFRLFISNNSVVFLVLSLFDYPFAWYFCPLLIWDFSIAEILTANDLVFLLLWPSLLEAISE